MTSLIVMKRLNLVRKVEEHKVKALQGEGWEVVETSEPLVFEKLTKAKELKAFAEQEKISLEGLAGNASAEVIKTHIQKALDERNA